MLAVLVCIVGGLEVWPQPVTLEDHRNGHGKCQDEKTHTHQED